jgi:hypothetical protein
VCEKWTLTDRANNSLLSAENSLFVETFSLLIFLGNFAKNHCSTAVYRYEIGSQCPKIAKFPVKFAVSREIARRRARSALRRQPGSLVFREFSFLDEKGPPNAGFSHCQ